MLEHYKIAIHHHNRFITQDQIINLFIATNL